MIAWLTEIIELTIKSVLKFNDPPAAVITAEPTVSPTDKVEIANEPTSEVNKAVDISGSFGSWLTLIVKSVKLSQSVFESITSTVGLNGIQATSPVLPPTQLPQLSVNADPLTSPLQSTLKQVIVNGKLWISTSPISEFIVEVNVRIPAPGFTKRLLKVTEELLPEVTLLPSGTDCNKILIPLEELEMVNVPNVNPLIVFIDWMIAWLAEIIELTIKSVLKFNDPPAAVITAEPTVSPTDKVEIANEPTSEVNKAVDISGSFGSWLTLIVKSVKLSQSWFESITSTVGLNGIQATLPVLPPTQFPQLSINADPLTSPLQSTLKQVIVKGKLWISTSPISEFIVEVKVNTPAPGFTNNSDRVKSWVFPEVTLLLSGNEVATIKIPDEVFSIVKDESICNVLSSIDLTEILSGLIMKSTNKEVVVLKNPPPAILTDEPIVSSGLIPEKSKYPPSELKIEDDTSGSFGSWEKEKLKSVGELQFKSLKKTVTIGVKSMHGNLPVVPSTQLPQLSK